MARQNIKEKYLMCHIPIKMLKQHAIPISSLHDLKIYSSKRCRKLAKDKLCVYLANTAVLNIQISAEDITSDYRFLLRLVNTFTIDTGEYCPVMCYKVNDAKTFKNLVYYFICKGSTSFIESIHQSGSPSKKNICWHGTQELPKT